jgi:hypothetical protein
MDRAQRGVKRAQPDTPATGMDRAQRRGRGVKPSRDGAGTAQTPASGRAVCAVPASAGRLGVEGTTEEMGAGACTQTPGAPAAGRSAAATRQRVKCALPHGELCGVRCVVVNKDSNGHRAQHVNGTAHVKAHAACDSLPDRFHASDILHVTPRQIFRALPAHIRHVGCVDASCDGGSKCSSYEDFLGYVGQSLCARAQSTLRVRARACLHDRRQNNTLPARSTCSQFTVELHGLVCDDVGRGIGLRRDGDLDCLPVNFHPIVREEVDDFVGEHKQPC